MQVNLKNRQKRNTAKVRKAGLRMAGTKLTNRLEHGPSDTSAAVLQKIGGIKEGVSTSGS